MEWTRPIPIETASALTLEKDRNGRYRPVLERDMPEGGGGVAFGYATG